MGDQGCGHVIPFSVCRHGTIALALMKNTDNYASEAEDMTTLIILARYRIGPLSRGMGSLSEQKMCDPTRLQARVLLRCAALECVANTMLLNL